MDYNHKLMPENEEKIIKQLNEADTSWLDQDGIRHKHPSLGNHLNGSPELAMNHDGTESEKTRDRETLE